MGQCRQLFKNIFDFTTAGAWDCVAAVERLPVLQYSEDFICLSFGIIGFILALSFGIIGFILALESSW